MNDVQEYVEGSGYARNFGVELAALDDTSARLHLPYRDQNTNPGKALHGGCAASLGAIGAQVLSRHVLGAEAAPFHCAALQVSYLAAAVGEDIDARVQLLRRGKELCFVEVDVSRADGKSIAHIGAMVRGRFGEAPAELAASAGDDGTTDPGFLGPHIPRMPYMGTRGIQVERMTKGLSRATLPASEGNRDSGGGVHEGAVLALLDTTGAMAAWSIAGPGPHKASTPAIQAQLLAPAPDEDLIAYARVLQRDGSAYWSEVEAVGASTQRVFARAMVHYRIVIQS